MKTILQKIFINYLYLLWFILGLISFPVFVLAIALKRGLDFITEHEQTFENQLKKELTND